MFAVPVRAEVPLEETWELETIFPSDEVWEEAYDAAEERLRGFDAFRGRIAEGPPTLLAALRLADEVSADVSRVVIYAVLRRAEDATNTHYGELADRAIGLEARADAAAAFLRPEIATLSDETIAAWMRETPALDQYRHAITRITRQREHIRSSEIEELLARASEMAASSEITQSVLEEGELPLGEIVDEAGARAPLAHGNLQRYLDSGDRRVRREAWEQSADAYLAFRNTFASTLAGAVKKDVFYARARGYRSALEAALAPDAIPPAVFHTLIETVWQNFPVWHRYFRVRRQLLGLPEGEQHGYDLDAPLAEPMAFPWERGVATILASLAPLGPEYVGEVRRGMDERWVDRGENNANAGGDCSAEA
jgi:oligoendopeptidase F